MRINPKNPQTLLRTANRQISPKQNRLQKGCKWDAKFNDFFYKTKTEIKNKSRTF